VDFGVLPVYGLKRKSFVEEKAGLLKGVLLSFPVGYRIKRGGDTC
jgi:hypothetical protein